MVNWIDVVLKLIGSFLVMSALSWWFSGVSPYEGSALLLVIGSAIGLTLLVTKFGK